MKRLSVVLLALALAGCAKISLTTACPTTSTGVSFALSGSTVGNTLLSMLGTAAAGAGALKATATEPQTTSATMTYDYIPVFGADSGSLNCTEPPTTTTIVTSPPAQILH
jgi:hypothetical protein